MQFLRHPFTPLAIIVLALITFAVNADAQDEMCDRTSASPCACDLTLLRPLQGAVGEEEVRKKAEDIDDNPEKARSDLKSDPIIVIFGYGSHLYIADHHHLAKAWVESAANATVKKENWIANGVCKVMNKNYGLSVDFASEDAFWNALKHPALHIWLKDENGQKITPDQLPKTVANLPDDPYRTFARKVEKKGGFCKYPGSDDFLEFMWADAAFRSNAKFQNVDLMKKDVVQAGVNEARDPKYKCIVPGWTADDSCSTPPTCPSKP
jgi:hypothetical protein